LNLYEILVPTKYGDTLKPISTKHHKSWDAQVRKLAKGLTILTPAKGQWVDYDVLYEERIIPVRIMCNEETMQKLLKFSIKHYRQKAIMFFVLSERCFLFTDGGV